MGFNVNDYFEKKNVGDVFISFKGCITSDLITEVLVSVEGMLNESIKNPVLKKKVYNVLVESLQNLYHHIDDPIDICAKEIGGNFGMFVISKEADNYKIATGNFIKKVRIPLLKERLDKINGLSGEELKEWYKEVLNNQMFSEKGGGGLGLIDIARRSGKKLEYNFFEYDKKFSFFSLNIIIS